ncbi:Ubiquitin-related modifier 1 [Hanseniaspora vineae]
MSVALTVEFLGGLDAIFQNQRKHKVTLNGASGNEVLKLRDLINYITNNMIENENDIPVFIQDGTVRPGILTLVNDTDWELCDEEEYVLESGDVISFTSTLHGG